MGKIKGLIKWIWHEGLSQLVHSLIAGAWPTVSALVIGMLAAVEHFPWAVVLLFVAVAFGFVSWGMFYFQQLIFQKSVKDKISFDGIELLFDYERDPSGVATAVTKAKLIMIIRNQATFPIYCFVDNIFVSVEGRVERSPLTKSKGRLIPAMKAEIYYGPHIPMDGTPIKPALEGLAKFTIRYGRKGNEKYSIDEHLKLRTGFDRLFGAYIGTRALHMAE